MSEQKIDEEVRWSWPPSVVSYAGAVAALVVLVGVIASAVLLGAADDGTRSGTRLAAVGVALMAVTVLLGLLVALAIRIARTLERTSASE